MKTKAAVLTKIREDLEIVEIEIPSLKPGQVLIDIAYSGVCHTQLLETRGHRGEDKFIPHCLGHEGSGIVEETGPQVKKVKKGDKVILSWMKSSGLDVPNTVYSWGGKKVSSGAIITFSKKAIVSENRIVKIPADSKISMEEAALLGCALPTGFGAVTNVAKPKKGNSIAVFGSGGIGLFAVCAAKIMGCSPIIAVDINEKKLETAKFFGATHFINASKEDPVQEISKICALDFAVECSGSTKAMLQCIQSVRNQGGTVVIVGNAKFGETLCLDPKQFNLGKKILGTWGGDNDPDTDFVKYIKMVESNKVNLEPFISKKYSLEEVNIALQDLESGSVNRPLIDMGLR